MTIVNRAIKFLVLYDFVVNFGFGLLAPIFAVFILQNIAGGSLEVIGTATACYWIARITSTVPLSRFMDKTDGERDEFYFAVVGTMITASIPLLYLTVSLPWHIYVLQFIYGLANSMVVPGWRILFTDHIDKGKTGFEWSMDDIGVGLAVALSAYIGAIIAEKFGFTIIMLLVSLVGYIGILLLLPLNEHSLTLSQLKRRKKLHSVRIRRAYNPPTKQPKIKFGAV